MFNINLNNTLGNGSTISVQDILELERLLLDKDGRLQVAPSERLISFTTKQIQYFCVKHGIYSIPTVELINFLTSQIKDLSKCIEIGSGNGVYSRTLNIKGTDNFMQDPRKASKFSGVASEMAKYGQETVKYGANVEEIDGREAVRKYKAETVLCSWVTHRYNRINHHLGGNMYGVDFKWILDRNHTKKLILVGNKTTHKNNPIMELPHEEHMLEGLLFSRASVPADNCVFIWNC